MEMVYWASDIENRYNSKMEETAWPDKLLIYIYIFQFNLATWTKRFSDVNESRTNFTMINYEKSHECTLHRHTNVIDLPDEY